MKRITTLLATLACGAFLGTMIYTSTADVTLTESYVKSQLVEEINAAFTILNTVLDARNNIDASKVQGAYSDADGTMTVSNLTANGTVAATLGATAAALDEVAAATLELGAATATKVELADVGVETEVQGTLDVNGNADFDGTVTLSGSALNVTNGQAVTVAAGAYILNGIGGANDSTNTITLAAPAAAGQLVYLAVATASTNLITIADSGTVAASGAILLDGNDTAALIAVDTSTWCLLSESDN